MRSTLGLVAIGVLVLGVGALGQVTTSAPSPPVAAANVTDAGAPAAPVATTATPPDGGTPSPAPSASSDAGAPPTANQQAAAQSAAQLQALQLQLQQQSEQVQLLQQQLANQEQQQQTLDELSNQLEGTRQQLAAAEARETAWKQAQLQLQARLDNGILALRQADAELSAGNTDIDLMPIADELPGQARVYIENAQAWLNNGDLYSARSFLGLALNLASQARQYGTGIVPTQ